MSNQTVSVKDVIGLTIADIKKVNVPAEYLEEMGPPLSRALSNLKILYRGLAAKEQEMNAQQEPEKAPELQIVEGGNEDAEEKDQLEGTVQEQGMAD